jgi:hypothetical protein
MIALSRAFLDVLGRVAELPLAQLTWAPLLRADWLEEAEAERGRRRQVRLRRLAA